MKPELCEDGCLSQHCAKFEGAVRPGRESRGFSAAPRRQNSVVELKTSQAQNAAPTAAHRAYSTTISI